MMFHRFVILQAKPRTIAKLSICSLILLGVWFCSEGGSAGNGKVIDTRAPNAAIVFRPAVSFATAETVEVYVEDATMDW